MIITERELVNNTINIMRRLRKKHKLTQQETAEKIGMSVRNIQNWEQGIRHPPRWVADSALQRLKKELGEK